MIFAQHAITFNGPSPPKENPASAHTAYLESLFWYTVAVHFKIIDKLQCGHDMKIALQKLPPAKSFKVTYTVKSFTYTSSFSLGFCPHVKGRNVENTGEPLCLAIAASQALSI